MRMVTACAVLLLAPMTALAQPAGIVLPDLSALAKQAKEVTEVTLDADALKSIGGLVASGPGAPAKSVLGGLQGVYVRSFKFDRPNVYSMRDVEDIIRQADALGWKRLISVHSNEETTEIRSRNGGQGGMLIVSAEPLELTIVHISGQIDLAKLGSLQGQLGVPALPGAPGFSAPSPKAQSQPAPPATPAAPAAAH